MNHHLKLAAPLAVAILLIACSSVPMTFAADNAMLVKGNVRFEALSPALVRMEYSPTQHFSEEQSISVIGRASFGGAKATVAEKDGWLTFATEAMTVSYKLDSGPFTKDNLQITWTDKQGNHAWKYGDVDDKNLGGVPGTMDNRSMVAVKDPGPLTRSGYYFLDDSRSPLFDIPNEWVKPRSEKDSQDWYFMVYGNDYAKALREMAQLLGPIPMVPRYVFGAWFGSRAGYSAEEWEMIVKQFRDERLPLDVLVLDSDSTVKVIWSGYDIDLEQMPDLKGFLASMKRQNVKVTINEHYAPLTRESESNFEAIRKAMGLPEDIQAIPHDIANKKYAGLFWDLLHKPYMDAGMAFFWQDGGAATTMEGLESLFWTRHLEYLWQEQMTGKRTTAFCRLGPIPGSHRYGVFFTGDLTGIWESLPVLVPATVRGGNQLMPYMNNLCGGVFTVDLPQELYQRWVQFSSFSPTIWFHGVWGLRLPWEYGEAGMETYRKFVGLRYALLPYIYTYSRVAHDTGLPLVRGMYLDYPDQESSYTSNQQYLFGRDLLVAPVTKPGNGKPVETKVVFPAGDDWYDYFTGTIYQGGHEMMHDCPLDRMPVFARAGSIIPTGPKMEYVGQRATDPLTLDVYAGQHPAEFKLYEDEGNSLDYRKGAFAWTTLSFKPSNTAGDYLLTISPAEGRYEGQLANRHYVVRVHGLFKPKSIAVQQKPLMEANEEACGAGWVWDAATRTTTIRLPESYEIDKPVVVAMQQAGTFADAVMQQKTLNLRNQVREAKRLMKLKHAALLGGADIKKPPRVILKTEEVERELTGLIDNPQGISGKTVDFEGMRNRIITALTDKPFDSTRTIPESDIDDQNATKKIENGQFTQEEIAAITRLLRGAELPAFVYP